jgi:hypothetical protein
MNYPFSGTFCPVNEILGSESMSALAPGRVRPDRQQAASWSHSVDVNVRRLSTVGIGRANDRNVGEASRQQCAPNPSFAQTAALPGGGRSLEGDA